MRGFTLQSCGWGVLFGGRDVLFGCGPVGGGIFDGHNRCGGERVSAGIRSWRGSGWLFVRVLDCLRAVRFTGRGGVECSGAVLGSLGSLAWLLLWSSRGGGGRCVGEDVQGRWLVPAAAASLGERFPRSPWSVPLLLLWRCTSHDPHTIDNNDAADSPLSPARLWTDKGDWICAVFCLLMMSPTEDE